MRNTLSYARQKRFGRELIAKVESHHRDSLGRRWPTLADVGFIATWGGKMGFTQNEGGIFGEIGDGLYAVLTTDAAPMTRGDRQALGRAVFGHRQRRTQDPAVGAEGSPAAARPDPAFRGRKTDPEVRSERGGRALTRIGRTGDVALSE